MNQALKEGTKLFRPNTYPEGAVGHRRSAVTAPIGKEIFTKLEQLELQVNSRGFVNSKYIQSFSIPELFFASGMARGISPSLAPGEIIDSPVT